MYEQIFSTTELRDCHSKLSTVLNFVETKPNCQLSRYLILMDEIFTRLLILILL